jgi:hypothetical protein
LDGRRGGIDGDEGEDAFGATCKHVRQRDFAAAEGVEDGVDPRGAIARTRSRSPSP